jgi:hypothetical protein
MFPEHTVKNNKALKPQQTSRFVEYTLHLALTQVLSPSATLNWAILYIINYCAHACIQMMQNARIFMQHQNSYKKKQQAVTVCFFFASNKLEIKLRKYV